MSERVPEVLPHDFDESGSIDWTDESTAIDQKTLEELRDLAGRYPRPRSAIMPMLHLVQSVDERISPAGVRACAEILGMSIAEVVGIATFYTQFRRHRGGQHHVGVCRTALCAVMGGDEIMEAVEQHLGIGDDEVTPDGKFSLEAVECNAACDYAPVVMIDWEFMDNMTPGKTIAVLDDLAAGKPVKSTRGPVLPGWAANERMLAGFDDGLADEGPAAGEPSLVGLKIARAKGWKAPGAPRTRPTAPPVPKGAPA